MGAVTTPRGDQDKGTESLIEEVLQDVDRSLTKLRRRTRDVLELGREREELIAAIEGREVAPASTPVAQVVTESGTAIHGESKAFDLSDETPNFDPGEIAPLPTSEPTPPVMIEETLGQSAAPATDGGDIATEPAFDESTGEAAAAIAETLPQPAPVTDVATAEAPVAESHVVEAPVARAVAADDAPARDTTNEPQTSTTAWADEFAAHETVLDDAAPDPSPTAPASVSTNLDANRQAPEHTEPDSRSEVDTATPLTEVVVEYDVTESLATDPAVAELPGAMTEIAEYEIAEYEIAEYDSPGSGLGGLEPAASGHIEETVTVGAEDRSAEPDAPQISSEGDSPFAAEFEEHIEDLGGSLQASPFDLDAPPLPTSYRPRSLQGGADVAPEPGNVTGTDTDGAAEASPTGVAAAWDDFAGTQDSPASEVAEPPREAAAPSAGSRLRDLVAQAQEAERERSSVGALDFDLIEDEPALSRYDKNSAKLPTVGISPEELSSSVATLRSSLTSDKKSDKKSDRKSGPESADDRIEAQTENTGRKAAKAEAKAAKESAKVEAKRAKEAAKQAEEAAKVEAKAAKKASKRAKNRN